jgi:two-component system chemotaxis response regulator CheY
MSIRALIIDDLSFMRDAIRDILESGGISVAGEASDGKAGIEQFRALRPDIVILDITMPQMDGLAALKHITRIDPRAKVIMCSALGQQEAVIRAIQLGAKDFVVKPFTAGRILSAVRKAAVRG